MGLRVRIFGQSMSILLANDKVRVEIGMYERLQIYAHHITYIFLLNSKFSGPYS